MAAQARFANPFIQLVRIGRITCLEDLKRSYRKIVMRTHPDASGTSDRADEFVAFSAFYEEAKLLLLSRDNNTALDPRVHPRLQFYRTLRKLEFLDMPYAFHRQEHQGEILSLRAEALKLFKAWNPTNVDLYKAAVNEHQQIWMEKPGGPYLKHALALNVRPVLHNVVAFQLTGRQVYRRQARQNIKAIMSRLEEESYIAFRDYLSLLMQDMEKGSALFE